MNRRRPICFRILLFWEPFLCDIYVPVSVATLANGQGRQDSVSLMIVIASVIRTKLQTCQALNAIKAWTSKECFGVRFRDQDIREFFAQFLDEK